MGQRILLSFVMLALAVLPNQNTFAAAPAKEEIVPLIQMENVPLTDAIRQIARKAQLNIILDPKLSAPPYSQMTVSIRWENVTAREALIALLDNYGLVMVQ